MPIVLVLRIVDGSQDVATQEITFDDGSLIRIAEPGDLIIISDGKDTFRGRVSGRDFDYSQYVGDNAALVVTVWADVV
jgi:hypothetical protein